MLNEPGTTAKALLLSIRDLLIDVDGVLCHGDRPAPGLHRFFSFLRRRNIKFVLVSNNSGRSGQDLVEMFASMGISTLEASEVLPMCTIVADFLEKTALSGSSVYVIGGPGLHNVVEERGFRLARSFEDGADFVVVGTDHSLTYEKLLTATLLIRAGAKFVGTNGDRAAPSDLGIGPGNGATLAYLQAATDVEPLVLGKPEAEVFRQALSHLQASPEHTAIVGDRLQTDILGGQRAGLKTIFILSGLQNEADVEHLGIYPDLIFQDVGQLADIWAEAFGDSIAEPDKQN